MRRVYFSSSQYDCPITHTAICLVLYFQANSLQRKNLISMASRRRKDVQTCNLADPESCSGSAGYKVEFRTAYLHVPRAKSRLRLRYMCVCMCAARAISCVPIVRFDNTRTTPKQRTLAIADRYFPACLRLTITPERSAASCGILFYHRRVGRGRAVERARIFQKSSRTMIRGWTRGFEAFIG